MKKQVLCAIDLGATSGRIVVMPKGNGNEIEVVLRFSHSIVEREGKCFWDIDFLMSKITEALRLLALRKDIEVTSIGVDTWGCDIIFLDDKGKALAQPRSYRDPYTNGMMEKFFQRVPREKVYELTGIQFMPFNTLYQLFACSETHYEPFEQARHYLFLPDYINYLLTGRMACEYTILSTSQFLNPRTKQIEQELIEAAGAQMECFAEMVMPGEVLGNLKTSVADFGYDVPVVAVASHDTASAVASISAQKGEGYAYLSSGTWSLMGIVSDEPIITERSAQLNFTNEGGVGGTTRVLKNITGMWILEQCRKEWARQGKDYDYATIIKMYEESHPTVLFNPDDEMFANPESMLGAITDYCQAKYQETPSTDGEVVRAIFDSMVNRYKEVFANLQELAPFSIERLYVIGGGARNSLLNALIEQALGVPVVVGLSEATAIGNMKLQLESI